MRILEIRLDRIQTGDRMRSIHPEKIDGLATSMAAIGLRHPISVAVVLDPDKPCRPGPDNDFTLVAGLHRVKAAEKLGWDKIEAIEVDLEDIDIRHWEISENLHRAELSALERSEHAAE